MKVTISKLFEISKYLTTKSGQELADALQYLSDFAELTLRGLRNNLTFDDNVDCLQKRVSIRNNTETVVSIPTRKRVVRLYVDRVVTPQYYVITGFGWTLNTNGDVVIKIIFDGPPPSTQDIQVDITTFFG